MDFTNPLFLMPALAGVIFIIAGLLMRFYPPKTINSLYGYRTPNSMKSQEHWDYAQQISAREMIRSGIALIITGLLSVLLDMSYGIAVVIAAGIVLLACFLLLQRVEKAIKKKFNSL